MKLTYFVLESLVVAVLLGCGGVDPADSPMGEAGSAGSSAGSASMGGTTAGGAGNVAGTGSTEGGGGSAAGSAGMPSTEPLLPWAMGSSWTYRVTSGGMSSLKTTTIGALEKVGGTGPNADSMAFHVTTAKGAGSNDHTESWQAIDPSSPDRVLRYREQSFSAMTGNLQQEEHWAPAKLHADGSAEHTKKGATWEEAYSETKLVVGMPPVTKDVSDGWSVVDDDETVTVPAGTFQHVVHLRKVGSSTKDYWYARGVGKLKETGTQTEELTEYTLAR